MRRVAVLLLWSLAAFPALAQSLLSPNGPHPIVVWDFRQMNALPAGFSVTRASTEVDFTCSSGKPVAVSFANNAPALGVCDSKTGQQLGLGVWSASTIINKWARDLTQNTYWTPTNMTTALTATGIDGTANAATLLTATGNNATICAPTGIGVTLQQRALSAFIQAVTLTGKIYVSQDGVNWTDVTGQLTTGRYTRVPGGGHYAVLANSTACIQIGTSGDQINVDCVNVQADGNNQHIAPTPCVFTTSTNNVVRPNDAISVPLSAIPSFPPDRFTVVTTSMMPVWAGAGGTTPPTNRAIVEVDDGSLEQNVVFARAQSQQYNNAGYDNDLNVSTLLGGSTPSNTGKGRCTDTPGSNQIYGLIAPLPGAFSVTGIGYDLNTGLGVACNNGVLSGSQPEQSAAQPGFSSGVFTRFSLGPEVTASINGYIQRVAIYPGRLTGQALTAAVAAATSQAPNRHPGYFPLNDGSGGRLTWETGAPMQCNNC